MSSSAVVHVRNSRPLDLAIYGNLVVMGALGIAGLSGLPARLTALVLCIAFALVNELGSRCARSGRHMVLQIVAQTALVAALLALRSTTFDTFTFLFFMMSVQVMLVFPMRTALLWILLFYLISNAAIFWIRGAEGWFAALFNVGVFVACAVFGHALRATALARRDNERLLVELQSAQQQLQELAITTERNRLARDLHDSVKQQVFATIMQLGAARVLVERDPQQARQHIVEAEQLAQQAGAELSLVIHELRPVALGDKGLSEALPAYVAAWSRQSGIHATIRVAGDDRVAATTEYALLRIAQEALANVSRHSRATTVGLQLTYDPGAVRLTIADDGQGFETGSVATGVGLSSMRERIEGLGGSLRVTSRPGSGTTIVAHWEAAHV